MKMLTVIILGLLMLFSGAFVLEGRLKGCAVSGFVSANAGAKSVTLLAVNYRHNRTYYHLVAR